MAIGGVMVEFKIKPLSKLMGAQITGIDLRNKISKETKAELLKAITNHLVVCIKDQKLSPSKLADISRLFGKPKQYFVKDETVDDIPEVIVVSNINPISEPLSAVFKSSFKFLQFWPAKLTEPIVGDSSNPAIFNKVDFPVPLGPIRATISPLITLTFMLSKTFIL